MRFLFHLEGTTFTLLWRYYLEFATLNILPSLYFSFLSIVWFPKLFCFVFELSGRLGSYLLVPNKKTYEYAEVSTAGNPPGSYKEPGIGWITGYLCAISFIGLFVLIPLRKVHGDECIWHLSLLLVLFIFLYFCSSDMLQFVKFNIFFGQVSLYFLREKFAKLHSYLWFGSYSLISCTIINGYFRRFQTFCKTLIYWYICIRYSSMTKWWNLFL